MRDCGTIFNKFVFLNVPSLCTKLAILLGFVLYQQVVASVARMFLDAVGIVLAGETPKAVGFWFGHCQDNSRCVAIGLSEFFLAWVASSYFVWRYHEVLVDRSCNPYANFMSWQIIIGAAEWLPMSIMVGKVNMLIEYGHFSVSAIVNPIIVVMVTLTFSYLAYAVMKYTQNTYSPGAYAPFAFLHLIYCLGFATGFSWWTIVRSFIDFFPDWDWLRSIVCIGIIGFAARFYLTYGPEPIIPRIDSQIQVTSFRRSIRSFLVYSSMILIVMSLVEPSHGLLKMLVSQFHDYQFPDQLDFLALFTMLTLAILMVAFGSFLSSVIASRLENVNVGSISMSRSQMERSSIRGHNARLVSVPEHEPMELNTSISNSNVNPNNIDISTDSCGNTDNFEVIDLDTSVVEVSPVGVQEQEGQEISRLECLSVLTYDTLSFAAGSLWAYFILGTFAVLCSGFINTRPVLYIVCAFLYFVLFFLAVGRVCRVYFPTPEERVEDEAQFERDENFIEGADW